MTFAELLSQVSSEPSTLTITPDWMQGRAGYGGLSAALVYESMRQQLKTPTPVRCLQISFVGPISNEPFTIESNILREGKSVSQVSGIGSQNGEVKIAVQGSFGHHRESSVSITPEIGSLSKPPEACQTLPFIKGVMPEFTKHFDFLYGTPFPFTGGTEDFLEGYVRFKEPVSGHAAESALLGLVDAWPPATLALLKQPAPASSLSWTIEFMHPQTNLNPGEYTLYRADIIESNNGYGHTRAKIWNEAGELLAISQQTVTHFG